MPRPAACYARHMGRLRNVQRPIKKVPDGARPGTPAPARPFLKWVGGKRSIIPELLRSMPKEYGAYHEPFMGGGALFFAAQPEKAYLSDINALLAITFKAVRDDPDPLIKHLRAHGRLHSKEYYAKARVRLAKEKDPAKIAALFIYINKTCFNGLYRVNRSGGFNVPMGDYKQPLIADEHNLKNCSKALTGADIRQQSFEHTKIRRNDFYYLDPPYHQTYSGYDGSGFGDREHSALAAFCRKIHAKGGRFLLSNSDTPFIRRLYEGFAVETVSALRLVSCKGHQRGTVCELLIRNYGDDGKLIANDTAAVHPRISTD